MAQLDMDNTASRDHQLHIRILLTTDVKQELPHVKIGVDPQVSYTQGHCNTHFLQKIKFCQISSALGCILNK
jgi:hypothetical protein